MRKAAFASTVRGLAIGLLLVVGMPASAYQIMVVETDKYGGEITIGGTVVPYKEVTLAAQVPGRVQYIAGAEGDAFQKGNLLLSVDDEDIVAKRRAALANLAQAEAALRNARVQYSREIYAPRTRSPGAMPGMGLPNLFDQVFTRNMGDVMGFGNPTLERSADLYSQGASVSQAQSQVMAARSQIDELDAALRDARAIAPFDGVLVKKMVEVGDTVQPGQPLIKFAHTKYLRIQAEVPARVVPNLRRGMLVPAKLDIGGKKVKARVAQIYPVADSQKHTVTVKFDLPEGTPGGPGMYAEVTLPDTGTQVNYVPVIPKDALVHRGSLPGVYILNEENKAELRLVRLGTPKGDTHVTVLSGLKAGDRIVVNPPTSIRSGWSPEEMSDQQQRRAKR
jgi:multidrug efflux pump subunit AcrA (membrane-fusion protein)